MPDLPQTDLLTCPKEKSLEYHLIIKAFRFSLSGERGIRTLGTVTYTRFPSVLDRPL